MSRRILLTLCAMVMCLTFTVKAQELNCKVEINSDQIEGTYKEAFKTLEQAINDYMNTNVFTNTQFGLSLIHI